MKLSTLKSWRFWLLFLAAIFLGAQFVPVERSNPPVEGDLDSPPEIRAILKRSCYDCHSHETVWPWYSKIAPASWLLAYDVKEGRKHLNFSRWGQLPGNRQAHKLREIVEQVDEGEMPLTPYLWLHGDAALSPDDRAAIDRWVASIAPPERR